MTPNYFLVDNNALIALTPARVRTKFFARNCRVTADVLYEAREHPEHRTLERTACPITPKVLSHIARLMAGVPVGDTRLVDLYRNLGAADPGMVAVVLEERDTDADRLIRYTWAIVTRDTAVLELAAMHSVQTMTPEELQDLIDATGSPR